MWQWKFRLTAVSPRRLAVFEACLIGFVSGLVAVALKQGVGWLSHWRLQAAMVYPAWIVLPAIGIFAGLLAGWLIEQFAPEAAGSGIPQVKAALGGVSSALNLRVAIAKLTTTLLTLGAGLNLGRQGPTVQIGASIAAQLSDWVPTSPVHRRQLIAAGAAAGLAAGFNAPIAGVFFALEVVLGTTFETSAASIVLLSAVVSALIAQIGLGGQPAFDLPAYEVRSPLELPLYLGLGLFACMVSIAYTNSLKWSSDLFKGRIPGSGWLAKIPREVQPILGGLCVGLVALKLPQVLGVGYDTVEAMLRDVQFSLLLLITLLVVKLLLTAISLGSGLVGGIFAPAMFLGASLGAAYGKVLPSVFPMFASSIAAPPAYAMVGMAAVLAASVNAPLTAILLLFEMTRDYRIVLPLMAAVGLSVWLVNLFKSSPEQPSNLQQIEEKRDPDPVPNSTIHQQEILRNLSVAEAMQPRFLQIADSIPLLEAGLQLIQNQSHSALVVNDDRQFIGIITLQDINRAIARWETEPNHAAQVLNQRTIAEVCTTDILYAYQDEPLTDALDRMAARGLHQLPVIDRADPHQILGLLEQEGITLACNLALTRVRLMPYLHAEEANPTETKLASQIGALN
ncbi:MAG: chloride channel protein [Leptolyngbya sp. ERB_1_1]